MKNDELAIVVAFDPGGTTGWCALGVEPLALYGSHNILPLQDEIKLKEYGQIDCGARKGEAPRPGQAINVGGENDGIQNMLGLVTARWPKSAIVIEDFILDFKKVDKTRDALSPVRLTAAFSFGLWRADPIVIGSGLDRIFIQDRVNPKTTCTDARLKEFKLYDRHSGEHARDAMRHAYYFMRQCRGNGNVEKERRYYAWPHLFDDPSIPPYLNKQEKKRKLGERVPGL
jgi:hypothetical protein